jgi:rhodanese-related sulfurtransferase
MRSVLRFFSLAVAVTIFSSCINSTPPPQVSFKTVDELVNDAKERISEISVQDFKALMDSEEPFVLIDVRETGEHNAGYIPGSVSMPRGVVEFRIGNESVWENEGMYTPLKDEMIIIYCKKGHRGTLATESLKQLGYSNIKNIAGGYLEWISGYPDIIDKNEDAIGGLSISQGESSGGC